MLQHACSEGFGALYMKINAPPAFLCECLADERTSGHVGRSRLQWLSGSCHEAAAPKAASPTRSHRRREAAGVSQACCEDWGPWHKENDHKGVLCPQSPPSTSPLVAGVLTNFTPKSAKLHMTVPQMQAQLFSYLRAEYLKLCSLLGFGAGGLIASNCENCRAALLLLQLTYLPRATSVMPSMPLPLWYDTQSQL